MKWLEKIYEFLWFHTTGRPWTFCRRDFWHQYEIPNIIIYVSVGFFSALFYPRIIFWMSTHWYAPVIIVAVFYGIGVLHGHYFWGKKYIKNQRKGEGE